MMKSTNLLIRVTPDEKKILTDLAEKQGLTLSELLRTAPLSAKRAKSAKPRRLKKYKLRSKAIRMKI